MADNNLERQMRAGFEVVEFLRSKGFESHDLVAVLKTAAAAVENEQVSISTAVLWAQHLSGKK